MTVDTRDAEFVATLDRERASLQGTAYLLMDDPRTADSVLDAVLAHAYERQVPLGALRLEALRGLVSEDAQPGRLPWSDPATFELVDESPAATPVAIVADLGRLPRDQRAVLVLERFTELPSVQIAAVLDRSVDDVLILARQARAALTAGHVERESDDSLARELRAAVPDDRQISRGGSVDLAHGRRLIRRRRLRRGLVAAAAAVILIVLAAQLWPDASAPGSTGPVASTSPSPRANCDSRDRACQITILSDWRKKMASVVSSHLDPQEEYFSGISFSYDHRYETPGFWTGDGGALALEMGRFSRGSTVVYLQIATSQEFAATCGKATHTRCRTIEFMDGNQFTLNQGSTLGTGLEVQFQPREEVITVVARNTTKGQTLPIDASQLIALVQDERLQLPDL